MIRILLVDDHPVVRQGIRTILTERLKGAVVGEAGDAESALVQVRDSPVGRRRRRHLAAGRERAGPDQGAPARRIRRCRRSS